MCGRYYIGDAVEADELREIIEAVNRRSSEAEVKTSGEINPSDTVPIIANSQKKVSSVFPMKWGYSLPDGKLVFNARSESAVEKPMFRDGMMQRRCVVPASHYFEWEHSGRTKTKYAIKPSHSTVMYMAGIYRLERGIPVFSILTRDPAESIRFVHDRMPVILPRELIQDWINPQYTATDLLEHALLDVSYKKADADENVQLSML